MVEFQVIQNGQVVAGSTTLSGALHYQNIYSQDGPCDVVISEDDDLDWLKELLKKRKSVSISNAAKHEINHIISLIEKRQMGDL